jgi:hypothetical protein
MARPVPSEKTRSIGFVAPESLHRKLVDIAYKRNCSVSELLHSIVREKVARILIPRHVSVPAPPEVESHDNNYD